MNSQKLTGRTRLEIPCTRAERHAIRGSWLTLGDLGPTYQETAWALIFGTSGPVHETKDILKICSALKPHVQPGVFRYSAARKGSKSPNLTSNLFGVAFLQDLRHAYRSQIRITVPRDDHVLLSQDPRRLRKTQSNSESPDSIT